MSDDPNSTPSGEVDGEARRRDVTYPVSVETMSIETRDDVTLEAEAAAPSEEPAPSGVVVACHPHPLYGGSMHANVVDALFRALPALGVAVLRFNFRGAGSSGGTHDGGRGERLDVEAALASARERWPDSPILLAGYSFGADVSLTVDDPALTGWLAVAPPLRVVPVDEMVALRDPRPKTIVGASNDQFNPFTELAASMASVPNATVIEAPGADHFFAVGLDAVVTAARDALGV